MEEIKAENGVEKVKEKETKLINWKFRFRLNEI